MLYIYKGDIKIFCLHKMPKIRKWIVFIEVGKVERSLKQEIFLPLVRLSAGRLQGLYGGAVFIVGA